MVWQQRQIFDRFSCFTYLRSSPDFPLKIGNPGRKNSKNDANLWLKLALKTKTWIQRQMLFLLLFPARKYRQILSLERTELFLKIFVYWEIDRACLRYIRCLFSSVDKFNSLKQRVISPKDHLKDARNAKVHNNLVAPYKYLIFRTFYTVQMAL